MQPCKDNFATTFTSYPAMIHYHESMEQESVWKRCKVRDLHVEPLGLTSPLRNTPEEFAPNVSEGAIEDTAENLGLALRVDGLLYPVRGTAYKTLLDRAKISGTILPKLKREELANILNLCLSHSNSEALVLVRDEKISATHSGDLKDYSRLPMDKLLHTLEKKMDDRFPGYQFESGYADHAFTSASWTFPDQKESLLDTYAETLVAMGKTSMANKLIPGIRFTTSDTGVASAKVSALIMGLQHPIHIGSCISVDHRHQKQVSDFDKELDLLFAQFVDSVAKLKGLLDIQLSNPINAMIRICKKMSLPKKEAAEAVAMYTMSYGGGTATAHDVFMALQEIPFLMKGNNVPQAKCLLIEENMARALSIHWSDYDIPGTVNL